MNRLTALILAVFLTAASAPPPHVAPIQPLHNSAGRNFCTAFAINKAERLWMTAKHCLGDDMRIAGYPVTIKWFGTGVTDLAVLQSEVIPVRDFKLAKKNWRVGDNAIIKGHPFGVPKLITSEGKVAGLDVPVPDMINSDWLTTDAGPGNSGSPIFNSRGEISGLLWGGWGLFTLSVPLDVITVHAGEHFSK